MKSPLFFLFLLVISFSASAARDIQLRLPVRITEEEGKSLELKKDDFKLFINGTQRNIVELIKRQKSLGRKPDLGRDIILSFHLAEYGKHVENGISYFITEILNTSDSLFILSPLKVYKINVSTNKGKMIRTIEEILKNDCEKFRKERTTAENQLINKIDTLKMTLSGDSFAADRSVSQLKYKKTNLFLHTFPNEFLNFKNLYMLLHTENYQQTMNSFDTGEGERWWINL